MLNFVKTYKANDVNLKELDTNWKNFYTKSAMNLIIEILLMIFLLFITCCCFTIRNTGPKPWAGCTRAIKTDLSCNFIPTDIPDGIKRVYLQQGQTGGSLPKFITKGTFSGKDWSKIEYLEFIFDFNPLIKIDSHGLSNLLNLRELRVHSDWLEILDPDAFVGLDRLQMLDMSTCPRLSIGNLKQALNGSNKLPSLQHLSILWMNSYRGGIEIGPELYEILRAKPLKSLDISECQISLIDFQGIQKLAMLETFNATGIKLNNYRHMTDFAFNHLNLLNLSYISMPDSLLGLISHFRTLSDLQFAANTDTFKLISNSETVDMSSIIPGVIPIQMYNVTLFLTTTLTWTVKNMKFRNNNFQYLDIRFILSGCSHLESIDVSNNQMQFLHPDILKQCYKLKHVDLSHNSLNQMAKHNDSYFKTLVSTYYNLTSFNMSNNKLETIPEDFFLSNKFLETIDLSKNLIKQVEFRTEHMLNLTRLDLSNNQISTLSDKSIEMFQSLADSRTNKSELLNLLDLSNNLFSCDQCKAIHSVKWILQSILVDVQKQQILCQNENGHSVPISQGVVNKLEELCERPSRIRKTVLLSTFVPLVAIVLISLTIFKMRKYKNQKKKEKVMDENIQLIQKNKADTRYLVFVSYSSADEIFVQKFVNPELTRHLRQKTRTDRELVCIGDKHFRLGKLISNEMVHCLQQSAVMLILVSKNYCHSVYCRNEFDQAQLLEKPIILMFKEEVNQCEMPAMMREVFTRYSRVLWEYQDGRPVLKTSWENVCTSILELMG